MAHIGLTPQYVQKFGGFRVQGRDDASRTNILADAMAVNDAGAFSVVIEGVPEKLAQEITQAIEIPTIGIGASAGCDGQVLVLEDMLGLTPRAPKFVKHYANLGEAVKQAAQSYAEEVRARSFPSKEHCYE
jgi:3-methyl-2-oxobutanoate hydroxymethyltransferase